MVLSDEVSKNEFLQKARNLMKTVNHSIFIVQDQSQKERAERRVLIAERDSRKRNGEDVVIWKGKIVPRRVRQEQ